MVYEFCLVQKMTWSRRVMPAVVRILVAFTLAVSLMFAGCVKIPDQLVNEEARPGSETTISRASVCSDILPFFAKEIKNGQQKAAIDSGSFRLLDWNIYKEFKKGWQQDLQQFASDSDIMILQEGYLAEELRSLLDDNQFYWVVAVAFEHKGISSGVLTASRVEPIFSCSFRRPEPLLRIPKTAIITLYPLSESNDSLLVANIHMVNFTMGLGAFRSQLQYLQQILMQHQGPIIVAGDFNTWSDKRCSLVKTFFNELQLKEVTLRQDNRSSHFGETVDRIYFRGLEVSDSKSLKVLSSDHNPILVTFRLQNINTPLANDLQ